MIINITDKIHYAIYGNENNTICVLNELLTMIINLTAFRDQVTMTRYKSSQNE